MKTFSQLMTDLQEASTTPTDVSAVDSINEDLKKYRVSVEIGHPNGGISANKILHVDAKSEDHARTVAKKHVKERGHKLYGVGSVSLHEGEEAGDELEQLDPIVETDGSVLVITPHGNKEGFYKVVSGIDGHLQEGEVVHESHVDDIYDLGYDVAIQSIDELSKDTLASYVKKATNDAVRKTSEGEWSMQHARDNWQKGDVATSDKHAGFAKKKFSQTNKRKQGIATAVNNLVK